MSATSRLAFRRLKCRVRVVCRVSLRRARHFLQFTPLLFVRADVAEYSGEMSTILYGGSP